MLLTNDGTSKSSTKKLATSALAPERRG